eukprot:Rhum_TRINITY_DN14382_c12_g1::Rhum_TRINITY_DN14382_c12_g1_i1::g.85352::m.85352
MLRRQSCRRRRRRRRSLRLLQPLVPRRHVGLQPGHLRVQPVEPLLHHLLERHLLLDQRVELRALLLRRTPRLLQLHAQRRRRRLVAAAAASAATVRAGHHRLLQRVQLQLQRVPPLLGALVLLLEEQTELLVPFLQLLDLLVLLRQLLARLLAQQVDARLLVPCLLLRRRVQLSQMPLLDRQLPVQRLLLEHVPLHRLQLVLQLQVLRVVLLRLRRRRRGVRAGGLPLQPLDLPREVLRRQRVLAPLQLEQRHRARVRRLLRLQRRLRRRVVAAAGGGGRRVERVAAAAQGADLRVALLQHLVHLRDVLLVEGHLLVGVAVRTRRLLRRLRLLRQHLLLERLDHLLVALDGAKVPLGFLTVLLLLVLKLLHLPLHILLPDARLRLEDLELFLGCCHGLTQCYVLPSLFSSFVLTVALSKKGSKGEGGLSRNPSLLSSLRHPPHRRCFQ